MTVISYHLDDVDLDPVRADILAQLARRGSVEQSQLTPPRVAQHVAELAVRELIDRGEAVRYWAGPRHRIRSYLVRPANFPPGTEVWLLQATPEVEKKLTYTLTSSEKIKADRDEAAEALEEQRQQQAELARARAEQRRREEEAAVMADLSDQWLRDLPTVRSTLVTRAHRHHPPHREEQLAKISGRLVREKRRQLEAGFKKRLNRPIPPELLEEWAPWPEAELEEVA